MKRPLEILRWALLMSMRSESFRDYFLVPRRQCSSRLLFQPASLRSGAEPGRTCGEPQRSLRGTSAEPQQGFSRNSHQTRGRAALQDSRERAGQEQEHSSSSTPLLHLLFFSSTSTHPLLLFFFSASCSSFSSHPPPVLHFLPSFYINPFYFTHPLLLFLSFSPLPLHLHHLLFSSTSSSPLFHLISSPPFPHLLLLLLFSISLSLPPSPPPPLLYVLFSFSSCHFPPLLLILLISTFSPFLLLLLLLFSGWTEVKS